MIHKDDIEIPEKMCEPLGTERMKTKKRMYVFELRIE